MATIPTPDWLQTREGDLRPGKDGKSCSVYFAGQVQYVLIPVPAKGRFACRISETINGRRLDDPEKVYAGADEAMKGGLDQLRDKLGW